MQKVSFIIIGAQKSGTTTLSSILGTHPQIGFCSVKEPGFFSDVKWQSKLDQYHSLFPSGRSVWGEGSTMYTFYPEFSDTAQNIYTYNPGTKLIYLMRDPISRIESHFAHRMVRGREKNDINEVVFENPGYINISNYYSQIQQYLKYFSRENIHLITMEKMLDEPSVVLNEIANFLGIDGKVYGSMTMLPKLNKSLNEKHITDSGRRVLKSKLVRLLPYRVRSIIKDIFSKKMAVKQELTPESVAVLKMKFQNEIQGIEALIGRELTEWRK